MASFIRVSKFRHVYGEELTEKYEDIAPHTLSSEGSLLAANGKNVAVAWASGNAGVLAVFTHAEVGRIAPTHGFCKGHSGPLTDFKFNPFHECQIMTASDDCTLKLWEFPAEGLTADLTTPRITLQGHSKKVSLTDFHPSAAFICASSSFDRTVKIWDLGFGCEVLSYCGFTEVPLSLKWSPVGRLLAFTSRDKHARVIDIRAGGEVAQMYIHEGGKPTKLGWVSEDQMLTCGFSKNSERQLMGWDLRKTEAPLKVVNIDQGAGVLYPYYDEDTRLLFIAGKGDGRIRYYELVDDAHYIHFIDSYNSSTPAKGFDFIPKRKVDTSTCEIMRPFRLTNNTIDQISFRVPRKSAVFQDDIFPPCVSGKPGLSAGEWLEGGDATPPRAEIRGISAEDALIETPKCIQDYERELAEAHERIRVLEERVRELESK